MREGHANSHVAEYENPDMPAFQTALEHVQSQLSRFAYLGPFQPLFGELDIVIGEVEWFRGVWNPWEHQKSSQGDRKCEDAIDYEEPPSKALVSTLRLLIGARVEKGKGDCELTSNRATHQLLIDWCMRLLVDIRSPSSPRGCIRTTSRLS